MGIDIPETIGPNETVAFIAYQPEEGKDVFLALLNNFRVITRYNLSVNYALVVTELATLLAQQKTANPLPLEESPPATREIPPVATEQIPAVINAPSLPPS